MKRFYLLVFATIFLFFTGVARAVSQPHIKKKLHLNFKLGANDVAFSPNGRLLYVATSRGLFLRETQTGKSLPAFSLPSGWSYLTHVQVSPHGRYLAAIAQNQDEKNRIFVWDLKARKLKTILQAHQASTMMFSPHEHWLVVSDWLEDRPRVRLIETRTWKTRKCLKCEGEKPPYMLAFSPNGKTLAGTAFYGDAGMGDLTLWNTNTAEKFYYEDGMPEGPLFFLPGGRRLALGVSLLNVGDPVKHRTYQSFPERALFPKNSRMALWLAAPYRNTLFFAKHRLGDGENPLEGLELWDVALSKRVAVWPIRFRNYEEYTSSPDGRWLVVSYTDIYEIIT